MTLGFVFRVGYSSNNTETNTDNHKNYKEYDLLFVILASRMKFNDTVDLLYQQKGRDITSTDDLNAMDGRKDI